MSTKLTEAQLELIPLTATAIGKAADTTQAAYLACSVASDAGLRQVDIHQAVADLGYTIGTAKKVCSLYWPTAYKAPKKKAAKKSRTTTDAKGEKAAGALTKLWGSQTKKVAVSMCKHLGITAADLKG